MRSTKTLFAALFLLSCCGAVWGQAAKTDQPQTVTQVLDHSVSNVEHEFVSAADAMPEDKYSFAPTNGEFKGVRTFAQQVKHVAATNYLVASGILGEKPPVEVGGDGRADERSLWRAAFGYAAWAGISFRLAFVRPLWANGRIFADERHYSACQPAVKDQQ